MKIAHLYMAGGAVALIGLAWLMQSGNAAKIGQAIGGAVVDMAGGLATGVGEGLNNPDINPLQPFGAWMGGTIYDLTHW